MNEDLNESLETVVSELEEALNSAKELLAKAEAGEQVTNRQLESMENWVLGASSAISDAQEAVE